MRSAIRAGPPDAECFTSLEKYAGTCSHPGYGVWQIQYKNGTLWNRMDRKPVLSWTARLEHLSADRFFVIGYTDDSPEDPLHSEAEFTVDLEDKAVKRGVILETKMQGGKIWFDRVT